MDEIVAVIILLAASLAILIYIIMVVIAWFVDYVERRKQRRQNPSVQKPETSVPVRVPEPVEPTGTASEPVEPTGTAGSGDGTVPALALTADELAAVRQMIQHMLVTARHGQPASKWAAIGAGFGCKRGGSDRAKRASQIHDLLIVTSYPTLEASRVQSVQESQK